MLIETLRSRLAAFNDTFGFDCVAVEQRSFQWWKMRLGVITASGIDAVTAKTGSATRDGYMATLIAEIATGAPAEPASAKSLQWGIDHEPAAIEAYQFMTGNIVEQIPFVYRDETMRTGCSPDGVMNDFTLEIKSPFMTRRHIELIVDGRMDKEYQAQTQFQMWVMGTDKVDFHSHDPRMLKHTDHIVTVERSDKHQALFNDAVPQFIKEMDAKLERLGFKFGEQFKA